METEKVNICLSSNEALIIFEFFDRFRETNEFILRNNAEYLAFSRISSQLDKALVEPVKPTYAESLENAKRQIEDGYEGLAPGVIP